MKKYKLIFLAIIQALLFFQGGQIFCQERMILGQVGFSAIARIHYFSTSQTGGIDPLWKDRIDTESIGMGVAQSRFDTLTSYTQSGNLITMVYGENKISFLLDTTNKKLYDFKFGFSREELCACVVSGRSGGYAFQSLDFQAKGDTMVFVKEYGKKCKDDLDGADWSYEKVLEPDLHHYIYDRYELESLIDDTSKYSFSLVLVSQKPVNSISVTKPFNHSLEVSNSLPDHFIHLSISSDQSQTMIIYDLLGREIKRIEIPSGVSEYSIRQGELPSGYYFARLGNMSAKFVVY
jgi:hypothetical protein